MQLLSAVTRERGVERVLSPVAEEHSMCVLVS
jgi:hypothetical protein